MKNLVIFILIICCCFLAFEIFFKREGIGEAKFQNDYLDTGLKRTIELKDRTLIHKVRVPEVGQGTKEGQSLLAAKAENFYIPPEGSFSYIEREDGEYKLDVKDYGFIFKLYFGFSSNLEGKFSPLLGARLFYYGRWGVGCGYSLNDGAALLFERRIDDFFPLDNTILFFGANKNTAVFGAAVFL